jgi:hypothetical protein
MQKKSPEMLFPFEVGTSPQQARTVPLSEYQTELSKDRQIQQEEQAAAARSEGAG